jgi:hypothetical protein
MNKLGRNIKKTPTINCREIFCEFKSAPVTNDNDWQKTFILFLIAVSFTYIVVEVILWMVKQ